ncbi:M2 family metallopeptidase [Paucibacter sp. R3-3]|uniref:M2 family metallopeptidase n=1 Tax=Roseateles agri TaxID=3098619 RepID=A0ABU5DIW0_9BURK|nr:M2 family metallopeptidase [Paucibacter sp. R3-3]MDY0746222.1 M2 family metallopeptidase [Paucibacter sp. R3-3]
MRHIPSLLFAAAVLACASHSQAAGKPPTVAEAQAFMDKAEAELSELSVEGNHAGWLQQTYINEDSAYVSSKVQERAGLRANELVIAARRFDKLKLPPALARKFMLLKLNGTPTDPKLVAELTQTAVALDGMYGKGKYCLKDGTCLGIEEIEVRMAKSRDPQELLDLWTGWHRISPPMRDKYARLVELSNQGAREFGFKDTGELWRSGYDMTPAAFSAQLEATWQQLQPLYKELHAYVRNRLVQKYGAAAQRADGMIPAHLLGNPWAQEWGNVYDVVQPTDPKLAAAPTIDLEAALKKQIAAQHPEAALAFSNKGDASSNAATAAALAAGKAMAAYGDRFYTSMGLPPLPETFWQRSQFVKPRDRDAVCHASAWDLDNEDDLRVKMCINVDADNFVTVHHEEGHNMYQRAYKAQPYMFRNGADDGFHEAIGDSVALAITPDYLKTIGLIDTIPPAEADIPLQLRTALDKVAFLPFGLLIDKWRWQVFSGQVKPADYNKAWWALREQYQGVAPPVERSEADFDPGAKYHIPGNVPYARYYLARLYQFQFYKAMCEASGYKGPLNRCTFYGSKAAGDKLQAMLAAGQSQPAQVTLKAMTGTDHLDAGPMLEYFKPLYDWLKQQNAASKSVPGWTVQ